MTRTCIALTFAGLVLGTFCFAVAATSAAGQGNPVQPVNTWKGSIENEALMKSAPKDSFLTEEKAFKELWSAWKIEGKAPAIDFKKDLVVLAVTRGSVLKLSAALEKGGDLKTLATSTRDLRPGFRYEIQQIARAGIKKVNGKDLK